MKLAHLFAPALFLLFTVSLPAVTPPGKTQQLTSPDQVPEGLAQSDWHSIRAAYEAEQHAFQPIESGWQARNPGQQWTTKFDRRGFVAAPKDGAWQWGLELKGYGFPGADCVISGVPAVKAEGQRLTYGWDAAVQEWWVNDARGLEHGFTVRERPGRKRPTSNIQFSTSNETHSPALAPLDVENSAPLSFTLAVRGSLTPFITADALGVEFRDPAGATVLTYTGLKVWDADGRILRCHFEISDSQPSLRLLVEERGARYPLTIDPIAQQAYLKASQVTAGDNFGYSVAVWGNTVVVGAIDEDGSATGVNGTVNEGATNSGAAYVFVRNGTNWSQQAYLKASQVFSGDGFGWSVAVSGDTVVVGANHEDSIAVEAGAAYVFVRSGTTWSQQAYLKASQVSAGDYFGTSVAVSGDTVVVGAIEEDGSAAGVNGTANELASGAGAAYVFVRSGATWSQQAYLKASQVSANDYFGFSVAVAGDTVVVGAPFEDGSAAGVNGTANERATTAGAAYVFVRNGTNWSQQAYLKASQVSAGDSFGGSVAVSENTVVVGANLEDGSATGVNGTVNEAAIEAGAAYVFVRNGTNWSQQVYLKASQVSANDRFGSSVAVWGNTVVVGAIDEDGSATGVNGTVNEARSDSGAAYVFVRSGTTWSQQAYLKASQVSAVDQFGSSVAVSGDTVVVGANQEDGSAARVNGTADELAADAGAAYIFTGLGPSLTAQQIWRQQYFGTTSNSGNAADDFDFDGDGLVNFLEWVCNLNPTLPSTLPVTIVSNGTTLEFTYTRRVSAVNAWAVFTVEWSDTLVPPSWSTSGVSETILSDNGTVQQVKALVPAGSSGQRFVHLKVTGPP